METAINTWKSGNWKRQSLTILKERRQIMVNSSKVRMETYAVKYEHLLLTL